MIKTDKTFWLARDKNGDLTLFTHKPYFDFDYETPGWYAKTHVDDWFSSMNLDPHLYPEVTFENSPVEIKFEMVK